MYVTAQVLVFRKDEVCIYMFHHDRVTHLTCVFFIQELFSQCILINLFNLSIVYIYNQCRLLIKMYKLQPAQAFFVLYLLMADG